MSRKKLPPEETKIKISICLSQKLNKELEKLTHNKSKYIEDLLKKYIGNGN